MTESEREAFEERAAILEFEAGYPRDKAEALAREIVEKSTISHEQPSV